MKVKKKSRTKFERLKIEEGIKGKREKEEGEKKRR